MPGGVWWIPLADSPGDDTDSVAAWMLHSCSLPRPSVDPVEALIEHFGSIAPSLVVVDGLGRTRDAAAAVIDRLLGQCPETQVLATGIESFRVPGEVVHQVPPMTMPDGEATVPSRPRVVRCDAPVHRTVGHDLGSAVRRRRRLRHRAVVSRPARCAPGDRTRCGPCWFGSARRNGRESRCAGRRKRTGRSGANARIVDRVDLPAARCRRPDRIPAPRCVSRRHRDRCRHLGRGRTRSRRPRRRGCAPAPVRPTVAHVRRCLGACRSVSRGASLRP